VVVTYEVHALGSYISAASVYPNGSKPARLEATLSNNEARDTVEVTSMVDVAATLTMLATNRYHTLTDSTREARESDTVTYTLHLTRTGDSAANNLDIRFAPLPTGLSFIESTHHDSVAELDSIRIVRLESLDSLVVVKLRVDSNATTLPADSIRWRAWVYCVDDVDPTNDTASAAFKPLLNDVDFAVDSHDSAQKYQRRGGDIQNLEQNHRAARPKRHHLDV